MLGAQRTVSLRLFGRRGAAEVDGQSRRSLRQGHSPRTIRARPAYHKGALPAVAVGTRGVGPKQVEAASVRAQVTPSLGTFKLTGRASATVPMTHFHPVAGDTFC